MRMRLKKHLDERKEECEKYFLDNTSHINALVAAQNPHYYDIKKIFGNDNPLVVELGCGKGGFAIKYALSHPDQNFVAVERLTNVAIVGAEEALRQSIPNLRFLVSNAEYLPCFLPQKSISQIFLNFSCPYPKKTYANRRLTHPKFLKIYGDLLVKDGLLSLKTDNRDFFEYSLTCTKEQNWRILYFTSDLYADNIEGNIPTEYETKFVAQGMPIYAFEACKNENF